MVTGVCVCVCEKHLSLTHATTWQIKGFLFLITDLFTEPSSTLVLRSIIEFFPVLMYTFLFLETVGLGFILDEVFALRVKH